MSDSLPNVGRPRGSAWRKLQDEGVIWEGQVLIPGDEIDLAALLIVTNERLALVRGGSIALDIPRDWLRPAPMLRRTGSVLFQVVSPDSPDPEPLTLIAREGRPAATDLVTVLTAPPPAPAPPPPAPKPKLRYLPESEPEPPPVPLARSHRRNHEHPLDIVEPDEYLPAFQGFQMLDADDFPPVKEGVKREPAPAEPAEPDWPTWTRNDSEIDPFLLPAQLSGNETSLTLKPIAGFESREARTRKGIIIRLSGLVLLLAAIGIITSGILPSLPDVNNPFSDDEPEITEVAQVPAGATSSTPSTVAQADESSAAPDEPTTEADRPTVVPEETAEILGVGGGDATNTPAPTSPPAPTSTEAPAPTATATAAPSDTVAPEATDAPVVAAQATEAPTVTPTPTEAEVIIPVEPTEEPSETATETPAEEPTETSTTEPTATNEPTEEPTEGSLPNSTDAATPGVSGGESATLSQQEATVGSNESPAQTFANGQLRLTIQAAYVEESIPELTLGGIPGELWVVLIVDAANWSTEPAPFSMSDFRLVTSADPATERALDETTGAIASFLGLSPSAGAHDTGIVAPGDTQRLALVFSVPPDSGALFLLTGDARIELTAAVNRSGAPGDLPDLASVPELIEGTVVSVASGGTVDIEIDGDVVTVAYLGIAAPGAESCYGPEALAANQAVVDGQTVWLERERRNSAGQGAYGRDVWIADSDGGRQLVAAELVREGAAEPAPAEPDTRFAGWLAGEAAAAQQAGAGLWSACA